MADDMTQAPLRIIGFPGRYIQGPGALDSLGAVLTELRVERVCTILDPAIGARLAPQVDASLGEADIGWSRVDFPGECTPAVIAALAGRATQDDAQAVVAIGGGKTIDTAKGVARALGLPIVVCPSAASSDAPTSRLIVLYDEAHKVTGVDYLPRNPDAVIVDTEVIVAAPKRLFAAGIGDAISKKYEAAQCEQAGGVNSYGTPPLASALLLTRETYATLMRYGAQAYRDVEQGELTDAVERVVEATVLLSGVGFESGGLSLAHALIRGLTAIAPMAAALHGELVAFGTLVQLFVEERPLEEIDRLVTLLCDVKLPVTLAQLGQHEALTDAEAARIVEATLATRYSQHMVPALTAERLLAGISRADACGQSRLNTRVS
jgi:glycerol dehydrogenase